jgi:SAM-dependent methyltransferase
VGGGGLLVKAGPVPGYYIGGVSNGVSPADRRSFITERRRAAVDRFDTLHSPHYDENWGAISPSHAAFVTRLITLIRPGGDVLDAACGTGKYWPALLAAGLRVTGVDQSAGMLAQALRKHPEVSTRVLALQDLAGAGDLRGRFDGLLCVDALENIAPEDWPGAAAGLAAALKPRTPAYVTVEVHDGPPPAPVDPRQVPGEDFEGGGEGGYHYYPAGDQVRGWLTGAGFGVQDEQDADCYWHLLLERR